MNILNSKGQISWTIHN